MKIYIKFLSIFLSIAAFGQVTIGKTNAASAPANATVSLEFGNATGGLKGIALPWVT